jgi:hypothetical protein
MSVPTVEAIERILNEDSDADDILRDVVATLVEHGGCAWAAVLFREDAKLVLGPQAGAPRPGERTSTPVVYRGEEIAQLVVDGCGDREFLDRVATLVAAHCLVGWDTGGVPWDAVS